MVSDDNSVRYDQVLGELWGLQPVPSRCLYKCLLCKEHVFVDFVNKRSFFSFKENRFPLSFALASCPLASPSVSLGARRIDIVLTGSQDRRDKGEKDVLVSV